MLQYNALRKCTGAVVGAEQTLVGMVAGVESVQTFAEGACGRFLARTMADPKRAGVAEIPLPLVRCGELSLGGTCWRGVVEVVDVGKTARDSAASWEGAIRQAAEGGRVVFTDGSMGKDGRIGGGWFSEGLGGGAVAVGTIGVVWDGEVAVIRAVLRMLPDEDALVLSDSTAALASISAAGKDGKARSRDLHEVLDMVGARGARGLTTRFGWCKAHVGIDGNEKADTYAKAGCEGLSPPQITEGGVRAYWRDVVAGEKKCVGFGLGRVVRWRRRAA